MCNRYRPASVTVIRDVFGQTIIKQREDWDGAYNPAGIGPYQQGPFVHGRGLEVGQWGLIPWFSKTKRPTGKGGRPISIW